MFPQLVDSTVGADAMARCYVLGAMTPNDSRADEIGRRLLEPIQAERDAALEALEAIYVRHCDDDGG